MTDNIMTLIDELRKYGLHEDLEFCKNAAEYLAQQGMVMLFMKCITSQYNRERQLVVGYRFTLQWWEMMVGSV